MQVSLHRVKNIEVRQDHHTFGTSFYCLKIAVETEEGEEHEFALFSENKMTLVNPSIREVDR